MDGVAAFAIHELAVAFVVATPKEADAGELIFGTANEVMAPGGGEKFVIAGRENGIEVVTLFPAGERGAVFLRAHLPAYRIAAEEGDVAAVGNELFETV